ncbi:Gfo/Idh/MocA family protein [Alkalihalobacterium bogoriense]|uniref:Gfo/Idh/MocA family protein n=1 Tax=Alkalihalobacterium bogoriense TaxID=246272 RepID=UPI00054DE11E|nr:Gfo/Idh/MocA family oxidoreductase [Alkalihalobacterium bogoriense]
MTELKQVRWGIIGCGAVTEKKSGPGFQKANHSSLVAVMRRNGKLAEDYAKRHHVPKWYDDAKQLIADEEVDAIYIATPPAHHLEYVEEAAKVGKPVYVEKPMARSFKECEMMIEVCEEANIPLFVAYYRRSLPRFRKIKDIIDSGVIGDINFVSSIQYRPATEEEKNKDNPPWRVIPDIAGGGLFFDLASHTLDVLDFLLGPIEQATGFASNQKRLYEAEDIVSGTYNFTSGAHGIGTWCFSTFGHMDNNEIVGTKGKLVFSTFGHEPIKLVTDRYEEEWTFERPEHIQQPHIQSIVDELLGHGKCPSHGKSAARTNWVMDQLVKTYYK